MASEEWLWRERKHYSIKWEVVLCVTVSCRKFLTWSGCTRRFVHAGGLVVLPMGRQRERELTTKHVDKLTFQPTRADKSQLEDSCQVRPEGSWHRGPIWMKGRRNYSALSRKQIGCKSRIQKLFELSANGFGFLPLSCTQWVFRLLGH